MGLLPSEASVQVTLTDGTKMSMMTDRQGQITWDINAPTTIDISWGTDK
jgi:hypothetical protein